MRANAYWAPMNKEALPMRPRLLFRHVLIQSEMRSKAYIKEIPRIQMNHLFSPRVPHL